MAAKQPKSDDIISHPQPLPPLIPALIISLPPTPPPPPPPLSTTIPPLPSLPSHPSSSTIPLGSSHPSSSSASSPSLEFSHPSSSKTEAKSEKKKRRYKIYGEWYYDGEKQVRKAEDDVDIELEILSDEGKENLTKPKKEEPRIRIGDEKEDIIIQPYEWEIDDKAGEQGQALIYGWCMDRESRSYLIKITDFPIFCQVDLPVFVKGVLVKWGPFTVSKVYESICYMMRDQGPPTGYVFSNKKKLYYHSKTMSPIILLAWNSIENMRIFTNKLKGFQSNIYCPYFQAHVKCNLLEEGITPIRKFLTIVKLRYTQWFNIKDAVRDKRENRISHLEREYSIQYSSIIPINNKVSRGWFTNPYCLTFDIECYSHNHKKMPSALEAKDVAYMISCIYQQTKNPKTRRRYGIIYGDCNHIPEDKIPNFELIKVRKEIQIIDALAIIIAHTDPIVIAGYNTLSFDYPYLDTRLKNLLKKWPPMGRIMGRVSEMISKTWESAAFGVNSINILKMSGRINIDLFPLIKRDYKYEKYTLDFVANEILKKGKHSITAQEMFIIYEVLMRLFNMKDRDEKEYNKAKDDMTRVMLYCLQDSELVTELIDKLNIWPQLVEMSSIMGVSISDLFTRGQQIRCLSQIYDLATESNIIINTRDPITYHFTGALVVDPIPGKYRNSIFLDFASLYPSIMIAFNICFSTFVNPKDDKDVPDELCHIIEFEQDEPTSVVKRRKNNNEDDNSYGDSDNEASDSDDEEEEGKEGKEGDVKKRIDEETLEGESKTKKDGMTKVKYRFKFVKEPKGLLPILVQRLIDERTAVRKEMEEMEKEGKKDTQEYTIMDKRQLALKVSANSFFGFLGVTNGMLPFMEGAMSITAMGRELITKASKFIITTYPGAKIVYGDTDSVVVDMKITDRKEVNKWGNKLSNEVSAIFPRPLKMAFEKGVAVILLIKRKNYVAIPLDKDGELIMNDKKWIIKGIALARRDICGLLRNMYREVLNNILFDKSMVHSISAIITMLRNLYSGKIPVKDLTIVRQVGHSYKKDTYFMKVFADRLRNEGTPVAPGERIDYVIVKDPKVKLLGHKLRTPKEYEEKKDEFPIDAEYYHMRFLQNRIDTLIQVGYRDDIDKMGPEVGYKMTNRHKFITMNKPILIMVQMMIKGVDLKLVLDATIKYLGTDEEKKTLPEEKYPVISYGNGSGSSVPGSSVPGSSVPGSSVPTIKIAPSKIQIALPPPPPTPFSSTPFFSTPSSKSLPPRSSSESLPPRSSSASSLSLGSSYPPPSSVLTSGSYLHIPEFSSYPVTQSTSKPGIVISTSSSISIPIQHGPITLPPPSFVSPSSASPPSVSSVSPSLSSTSYRPSEIKACFVKPTTPTSDFKPRAPGISGQLSMEILTRTPPPRIPSSRTVTPITTPTKVSQSPSHAKDIPKIPPIPLITSGIMPFPATPKSIHR